MLFNVELPPAPFCGHGRAVRRTVARDPSRFREPDDNAQKKGARELGALLIDEMLGLEVRDQAIRRQPLRTSPQWFSRKLKARSYRFERSNGPFNPQNER
ncbi:hypothetical protein [Mesorhizobium sp. M0496]|uniref:hypothetical protein n=1 Tax=unclassified Mesorhizobium TaxID=325217 RepID=UPI0033354C93